MPYYPEIHNRQSIRLKKFDYSQPCGYFITICTQNMEPIFGKIINKKMNLNQFGEIAQQIWLGIPNRYKNLKLDKFIVMPNHMHAIIFLSQNKSVGAGFTPALDYQNISTQNIGIPEWATARVAPTTVGKIIGSYKSIVSNECLKIYKLNNHFLGKLWQRNYFEHIIRNEDELIQIQKYITNNPSNWKTGSKNNDVLSISYS